MTGHNCWRAPWLDCPGCRQSEREAEDYADSDLICDPEHDTWWPEEESA